MTASGSSQGCRVGVICEGCYRLKGPDIGPLWPVFRDLNRLLIVHTFYHPVVLCLDGTIKEYT
jgi:hypothetical protein